MKANRRMPDGAVRFDRVRCVFRAEERAVRKSRRSLYGRSGGPSAALTGAVVTTRIHDRMNACKARDELGTVENADIRDLDRRITRVEATLRHLATKEDLARLEVTIGQRLADTRVELRKEFNAGFGELKNGMAAIEHRFLYWALGGTGAFVATVVGLVMFIVCLTPPS